MDGCRKIVAGLMMLMFVIPAIFGILMAASVSPWILDRGFYTSLVDNEALYQAWLDEELPSYYDGTIGFEELPAEAVGPALQSILTADYMRDQVVGIVDEFFDFFEGNDTMLDFAIDLVPVKESLAGEGGTDFAYALAENLPVCDAGQESFAPGATLPRCRPDNLTVEDSAVLIQDNLPEFIETIPDSLAVYDEPVDIRTEFEGIETVSEVTGVFRGAVFMGLIAIAGFWLLVSFMGGITYRGTLLWMGITLLLAAIPVLLIGLGISGILSATWVTAELSFTNGPSSPQLNAAVLDVVSSAISRIGGSFAITGGIATFLGLGVLFFGLSRPSDQRKAHGQYVTIGDDGYPEKPKRDDYDSPISEA